MLREARKQACWGGVREAFAEMAALAGGEGPPGRGKRVSRGSRWTCMNQGESAELDWLVRTRLGRPQHS